MAISKFTKVRIAGIASAVPSDLRAIEDGTNISPDEISRISKNIGVKKRCIVSDKQCTSDLCLVAGKKLLQELNLDGLAIDVLICVTQTPDYILPATSCVLQNALGLAKTCAAFDVNLGCSGYIYALWLASSLLEGGGLNRALILVGDTSSKIVSPYDRSTAFLFGDAGVATVLEKIEVALPVWFELGSDGSGAKNLMIQAGGFRKRHSEETARRVIVGDGNLRSLEDLYMNGAEIFSFTLREVPALVNSVMSLANWSVEIVDAFVMHQANLFILQYLSKRLKIPPCKMLLSINDFGNTSSASIPLTITCNLSGRNKAESLKMLLVGFGVGYSWGAVAISLDNKIKLPSLLIVDDESNLI